MPKIHGGPGLLISFEVGGSFNLRLNKDWRFKLTPSLNVGDLFIHLEEFRKLSSAGLPGQPSIKLGFEGGSEDAPLYRFGKEDGSHVEFGQFEVELELSTAVAGVKAVSRKSELVLNLGKSGDGFLSQILPGEKRIPLNLGLGWSTERGFFIDGGKGNVITQTNPPPATPASLTAAPGVSALSTAAASEQDAASDADLNRVTPVGRTFGPARMQFLSLALTPKSDNGQAKLTLGASIAADITLGPVTASFDKAGFALTADFAKPDGNLSLFDLDFGFQPPTAIGLDIDAKVVHGGGFLDLDREHSQYAGALHLEIEGFASLSALGLLNTNIPGGGFSLLVIITADGFKPIPIGFGFMLAGIGGLLGIHRTVNEDAVQAGVRANTLNAVLAPKDLIRNAPQYLSVIREFFPVARDHYLFGLIAQITWGTPTLVTINLALILELGVRTRFLIMGQVMAILPKKDLDLVRLQMNIFGGVDFDQKRAFLDAVLFDSRLVDRFVITGEMRMRLNWGDQPFFALVRRRPAPGLHAAGRSGTDAARGDRPGRLRRSEDPLRLLLRHHLEHRPVRRACGAVRQEIEVQRVGPGRLRRADSVRSVSFRRLAVRLAPAEGGLDQPVQGQLRRRAVRTATAERQRQGDVRDLVDRLHRVVQRDADLRSEAAVAGAGGCRRAAAHGVDRCRQLDGRHAGDQRAPGQSAGGSGRAVRIHPLSTLTVKQGVVPSTCRSRVSAMRVRSAGRRSSGSSRSSSAVGRSPLRTSFATTSRRRNSGTCPMTTSSRARHSSCCRPASASAATPLIAARRCRRRRTSRTSSFRVLRRRRARRRPSGSRWRTGSRSGVRWESAPPRALARSGIAPRPSVPDAADDVCGAIEDRSVGSAGTTTFATRLEAEDALKKLQPAEAADFQVVAKR